MFLKWGSVFFTTLCLWTVHVSVATPFPADGKAIYKLPEYMEVCQRFDPELDNCLKDNLQSLIPKFSAGAPEFRLPSLDPMHLSDLRMDYDNTSISASILVKNMKFEGISSINVVGVRTKFEEDGTVAFDVDVFFPKLFSEGFAKIVGKLWELNLATQVKYNVTMGGVSATWWIRGEVEERDGREFLKLTQFDMKPEVTSMAIQMHPIFPKSESMSEFAVNVINGVWPDIYEALLPMARANWDKIMIQLGNLIFQKIPLDVLLPV